MSPSTGPFPPASGPQADDDDEWLRGDAAPVPPDWSPPPGPPPADPIPAIENDIPFRPETDDFGGPDDPFEGILDDPPPQTPPPSRARGFKSGDSPFPPGAERAGDGEADDFDDSFEMGHDFDEEIGPEPADDFPPAEEVIGGIPIPPDPDAPSMPSPAIRPIKPALCRRLPWLQIGVYGTIVISVVAIMLGAIIAYTQFFLPSVSLNATYHSAAVGVTFKYPESWTTTSGEVAVLSGQAVTAVILSDHPVPPKGPYGAARLVIAVQRIDPVDVFRVDAACRALITAGPQRTFECMKQHGFLTPVYHRFNTPRYRGVRLPGTLPPQRASLPVILLPTTGPRWIALTIVHWNGYDEARDVWERIAKSLKD